MSQILHISKLLAGPIGTQDPSRGAAIEDLPTKPEIRIRFVQVRFLFRIGYFGFVSFGFDSVDSNPPIKISGLHTQSHPLASAIRNRMRASCCFTVFVHCLCHVVSCCFASLFHCPLNVRPRDELERTLANIIPGFYQLSTNLKEKILLHGHDLNEPTALAVAKVVQKFIIATQRFTVNN